MADISLSLPLTDILSSIINPSVTLPSTETITGPPVTITITPDPTTTTLISIRTQVSSSNVTSRSQSSSPTSTSISAADSTSTDPPEFLTTTFLTSHGNSLITITALVSNPSAHTHNNLAETGFFSNRTAVIGVFTSIGVVFFALIAAIIAWAARRRTLKRWQREKADRESFDRRNFLQDEMHDELSPSEKSWWAGASGSSIPGMPMRAVVSPGLYIAPPVPPLPTELSPTTTTFTGSNAAKSLVTGADTGGTIPHPYGSPFYSIAAELYQTSPLTHSRSTTSITTTREAARSPPPSTPLPPLPYSGRGQDSNHLPMILEGPPPSASAVGWASHSQPPPSGQMPPLSLARTNTISALSPSPSSSKAPSHPYTSPPTNRKSELYAEDVLLDLGNNGGIGRSLSGSRPVHPALPSKIQSLSENTQGGSRTRSDFDGRGQTSTGHTGSSGSHAAFRGASGSGISDGGWYDDSPSDTAKAATGAAASGESVLGGDEARTNGFEYSQMRNSQVVSANGLSVDIAERRKVPHDPRFSGLFGGWADSTEERYQNNLPGESAVSVDLGTEDDQSDSPYAPRILRVTNE